MEDAAPAPRRNYLVRHWRGEFPLVHAFWVNEVLISLLCLLATTPLYFLIVRHPPTPATLLLLGVPFMALALAVTVWQAVGVWRSARHHRARGGKHRWVTVVRVLVIIGAVQTVYALLDVVPAFNAALRLAMDPNAMPPYRITQLSDTELAFNGGLGPGSLSAFEQALADHPGVTTIQLDSVGGLFGEARAIAGLIEDKRLVTYTNSDCMSACTLLFMAGKERLLGAEGRLGFHAATLFDSDSSSQPIVAQYRAALLKHGASTSFVDKVLATDRNDMWFPDTAELLRERIISATVDARDFTDARLAQLREPGQLDLYLGNFFLFRTLAEHAPATYAEQKALAQKALDQASTYAAFNTKTLGHDSWLFQDYLRKAPQTQLLQFWQAHAALVDALAQHSAQECGYYLTGNYPPGYGARPEALAPLFAQARDSRRELITSAANSPQPDAPTTQAIADVGSAFDALSPAAYTAYSRPRQHTVGDVCNAYQAVYHGLFALPDPTRVAQAFRLLPGYQRP